MKTVETMEAAVLTVRELSQYLQCHQSTIRRLLKRKALPYFKMGSDYRFIKTEINKWMFEHSTPCK